ncbi:MAG TPA: ABC transporter ATP-binding protein [Bacillota bacterium]|jgi:putative ABC transport system ATP-binding protein|nr:ABC transporter ATP-binding protein [Bacillota bacterium]HQC49179.1 ABC transporter ATP-binding protein [Bacillota bacterium]
MDILSVQNLKKYYGKDETLVKAIDDVSFSVEKGDFVAIIGPSGSGKSTLMHAIGGVDRPTDGKVLIDNQDIYQLSDEKLAIFRRRQVGLIYQFYNLIPILTVEENIKLPLLLDHQKVDDDKFNALVRQLGIHDRLNHLPNQLSGGQQQRVSIGRSLIYSPAIVLADEPTGNLDSDASREIVELLIDSNQRLNQTILIITHDERIAMRAKRILALKDGKIVRDERVRK